jgi:phage terminase large subunit
LFASSSPSSPVSRPPDPFLLAADIFDPPVDPYAQDPAAWAWDFLGIHLWSRQRDVAESVRDHSRTAVRSGHGIGKTLVAAVITLWFLDTHPASRVITTATKWSQVKNLLWHEVNQLAARAASGPRRRPAVFRQEPLQTELHLPDGRYAIGLSSKPENSESFAGHHAPNILVVVDEASGVHPKIFEVAEGYMTTDGARMLLIGNPTRSSGEFFDAFNTKRGAYNTLHISALESPAITGEQVPEEARVALTGKAWVESRRKAWGEDSALYQVRVKGNFAKTSTDTVIDLGHVEDAIDRELPADSTQDLVVISCDVARFGDDETVIAERVGQRCRILETYVGRKPPTSTATGAQQGDLVQTAGRIEEHAEPHPRPHVRIVVDDTGVGGGVTDILRNRGWTSPRSTAARRPTGRRSSRTAAPSCGSRWPRRSRTSTCPTTSSSSPTSSPRSTATTARCARSSSARRRRRSASAGHRTARTPSTSCSWGPRRMCSSR